MSLNERNHIVIQTKRFSIHRCISELYGRALPNVSVIIVFHNEHLKTLLRTCYTIVRRTPAKLLSEIILVDDASTTENLSNKLVQFTLDHKGLPSIIKVIRLEERHGAMKARIIGAKEAQCKVLVFLDAHCEVNHNWLPPLLGLLDTVSLHADCFLFCTNFGLGQKLVSQFRILLLFI